MKNKLEVQCRSKAIRHGLDPLLQARRGDEEGKEMLACASCTAHLQQGRSEASLGRVIMAAILPPICGVKPRPLPPRALVTVVSGQHMNDIENLQGFKPFWRPFCSIAVSPRIFKPSSFISNGVEVACAKLFSSGAFGAVLESRFQETNIGI
jgi:hypothetical protein